MASVPLALLSGATKVLVAQAGWYDAGSDAGSDAWSADTHGALPAGRLIEMRARAQPGRALERGFTLVELLLVVAMIGVLAAIGVVSYRRYVTSAEGSEAVVMVQAIRGAEEAHKAETLMYLGCSASLTSYYPQTSKQPDGKKWHWENPAHTDYTCWRMMNVSANGPVRFGYAVMAGNPGAAPPDPTPSQSTSVSATPTEPWYVIQATGDLDNDLVYSHVSASSWGEVLTKNEGE